MTKHIRILPSGNEFACEGNSTILEAGLSAGLALGYGCSNGNCGKCQATVVSGEVKQTRHHDYKIKSATAAGHPILMCCNTAASDLVLEAAEAQDTGEIPRQQITARVKGIQTAGENVALVHLKTPRSNRLRFLAGQHVTVGRDGIPAANCSVASCPCDDMNLLFQLPRIEGDVFSDYVFNSMKKGDALDIDGPHGDFILNESSSRSIVFIAWRTGFGPIRSLVEHAMALEIPQKIHLVWMTADEEGRYLDNLCRSWRDALDDFSYIPVNIIKDMNAAGLEKVLFEQMAIKPRELSDYDFYVAGDEPLKESCRAVLLSKGLPTDQLALDQLNHR